MQSLYVAVHEMCMCALLEHRFIFIFFVWVLSVSLSLTGPQSENITHIFGPTIYARQLYFHALWLLRVLCRNVLFFLHNPLYFDKDSTELQSDYDHEPLFETPQCALESQCLTAYTVTACGSLI